MSCPPSQVFYQELDMKSEQKRLRTVIRNMLEYDIKNRDSNDFNQFVLMDKNERMAVGKNRDKLQGMTDQILEQNL